MSNIATTIEQSKHLLELGLDPKTADMVWMCNKWLYSIKDNILNREQFSEQDTLAWSLSALLDVMPKEEASSTIFCGCVSYLVRCKSHDFMWQHDSNAVQPVTASYEMVCWLLEQGLIKKGGNNESD